MKKFKNLIITITYLFIMAIIFSCLIFKSLSIINILFYLLESITFGLIINLMACSFKEKTNKIITSILLVIITIFYIAQFVHYNFYDCFFSIYSLVNGGQVFGFLNAIIKEIINNIFGIIILVLGLVLAIILIFKNNEEYSSKKKPLILAGLLILNIIITISLIYIPNSNDIYSRKNLLEKTNSETKNTESFGLITAMVIDSSRYLSSYKEDIIKIEESKEVFKEEKNVKYNKENLFKEIEGSENNYNVIEMCNNILKKNNSFEEKAKGPLSALNELRKKLGFVDNSTETNYEDSLSIENKLTKNLFDISESSNKNGSNVNMERVGGSSSSEELF